MSFDIVIRAQGADAAGGAIADVTDELARNEAGAARAGTALKAMAAAGVDGGGKLAAAMREEAAALDRISGVAVQGYESLAKLAAGMAAEAAGLDKATRAAGANNDAMAKLKQVRDALANGRDASKIFAADDHSVVAVKARNEIEQATQFEQAVKVGEAALARQAAMLEKIHGPIREYEADLKALNTLLEQGRINTSEYNAQLERLSKQALRGYGPVQGPAQQPAGAAPPNAAGGAGAEEAPTALGTLGTVMGVFAAGGAIMGVVGGIKSVIEELHDLEDESIRATNAAQKFVDAQHDVGRVMAEQLELGDKVHASYDTTIKLYDKVREGSDGVALSHSEQLRLTQTLGEAVQLSNKPVDAAAGLMSKFAFAMQSGTIQARELRSMMREVPAITHLWNEAFHTTDAGLMDMVKHGKLTIADLVTALSKGGADIDAKFAKIKITNQQAIENWWEGFNLARQHARDTSMEVLGDELRAHLPSVNSEFAKLMERIDDVKAAAERADQAFTHWFVHKGVHDAISEMKMFLDVTEQVAGTLTRNAGLIADPWGSGKTGFGAQLKLLEGIKGPINDAKQELENLGVLISRGLLTQEEARVKYDALMTTINDGRLPETIKQWEAIHLPMQQFHRDVAAANALLRSGEYTLDQYRAKLQQFADTAGAGELWRFATQYEKPVKHDTAADLNAREEALVAHERLIDQKMDEIDKLYGRPAGNPAFDKNRGAYGQVDEPDLEKEMGVFEKRNATLQALGKTTYALADAEKHHADVMQAEREVMQQILGPTERYKAQQEGLKKLLSDHTITMQQYNREIDKSRATYLAATDAGKTFAGAMEAEMLKLKEQTEAFNQTLAHTLVDDVDKLSDAFVTMANGGAVSWSAMIDSMLQDLERLIMRQLVAQALVAAFGTEGGGGGGTSGVSTATVLQLGGSVIDYAGAVSSAGPGGAGAGPAVSSRYPAMPAMYPAAMSQPQPAAAAPAHAAAPIVIHLSTVTPEAVHAAMDTPQGHRVALNVLRANEGFVRGLTTPR